MRNVSVFETNSQSFIIDNHLSSNLTQCTKADSNIFTTLIETKSYSPITGCVLAHLLHTEILTEHEKLFYLLADSNALTRVNKGHERASIISANNWAKKLNCSKSQIFLMQKGLEEKGYFNISRDSNKFGKNQKNVIYPTLPNDVFASLCQEPNRFNINGADDYANYLFNHHNKLDDGKRRYLDKTKLFIKINHQLLSVVVAERRLSSLDKLFWLDFYLKCYKQYCKNHSQNNEYFSFTISYLELQNDYRCSKASVSKAMIRLEMLGFIHRQHFYVKNDDDDDNLHDKSLWTIMLSLPPQYQQQMLELQDRGMAKVKTKSLRPLISTNSNHYPADYGVDNGTNSHEAEICDTQQLVHDISCTDPYISKTGLLLNKDLKLNIKNKDKKDGQLNFLKITNTAENPEIVLSKSNKNYVEKQINTAFNHSGQSLLSTETKGSKPTKATTPVTTKATGRGLKSFHPLNELQVDKLNQQSGRSFNVNFANELLLKLARRYPDKTFLSNNHMIVYMSKVFRYELHQATLVNNPSFRFAVNHPASFETARIEQYLAEVEYSRDTSSYAQLRRKIAGIFAPSIAYQLLSNSKIKISAERCSITNWGGELLKLSQHQLATLTSVVRGLYGEEMVVYVTEAEHEGEQGAMVARAEPEQVLPIDDNSVWRRVRQHLIGNLVDGVNLNCAWFSKLTAQIDSSSQQLRLIAPTNFIRDYIKNKYWQVIAQYCNVENYQLTEITV